MANTVAGLSEPVIASMAAGLLDDFKINSLDDPTTLGRFFAREFGVVRDEILESYPWHFAKTRSILSATGTPPAFDWAYQYQLPDGCLRPIPPNVDGKFNGVPIPYEVESGKLLCNVGPTLKLIWIRREIDMTKWMTLAGRAFAGKLAMYAAQRVTGKAQYFEKARAAYNDGMFEARVVDSLIRGTPQSVIESGNDIAFDSVTVRGLGY